MWPGGGVVRGWGHLLLLLRLQSAVAALTSELLLLLPGKCCIQLSTAVCFSTVARACTGMREHAHRASPSSAIPPRVSARVRASGHLSLQLPHRARSMVDSSSCNGGAGLLEREAARKKTCALLPRAMWLPPNPAENRGRRTLTPPARAPTRRRAAPPRAQIDQACHPHTSVLVLARAPTYRREPPTKLPAFAIQEGRAPLTQPQFAPAVPPSRKASKHQLVLRTRRRRQRD